MYAEFLSVVVEIEQFPCAASIFFFRRLALIKRIDPAFHNLIYRMAKATVAAIITPDDDKRDTILLTKRSVPPFKGQWCLPGGHIDDYETAEEAVVREVEEETGLLFSAPVFLHFFNEVFPEHHFHAVALAFSGRGVGSIELKPDEVEEIAWFPLDEALTLPLAFNHLQIIRTYYSKIRCG